jgi:hypothetical protein
MHAWRIIQDLLSTECPSIHAKRRDCLAATVEAGSKGSLSLMGISRALGNTTAIRRRIKRCDRLLGNSKMDKERHMVYAAITRRIMCGIARPLIIVDWSDLRADRSLRLLRAALVVQGKWGTGRLYRQGRQSASDSHVEPYRMARAAARDFRRQSDARLVRPGTAGPGDVRRTQAPGRTYHRRCGRARRGGCEGMQTGLRRRSRGVARRVGMRCRSGGDRSPAGGRGFGIGTDIAAQGAWSDSDERVRDCQTHRRLAITQCPVLQQ